jgi:hypothetical protein
VGEAQSHPSLLKMHEMQGDTLLLEVLT